MYVVVECCGSVASETSCIISRREDAPRDSGRAADVTPKLSVYGEGNFWLALKSVCLLRPYYIHHRWNTYRLPSACTDMADLQAIAGQLQASLDPQQSRQGTSRNTPLRSIHSCAVVY